MQKTKYISHECPFCGAPVTDSSYHAGYRKWHTECPECGARGPLASDPESAIRFGRARVNASDVIEQEEE